MKTPEGKRITLTFHSHPMKDLTMRWKASVTFEPGSDDDSFASIRIVDGEGEPVAAARFEFAGQMTEIRDGQGAIRCGDFVKGKHEPALWLHREGLEPVPGVLTFE